MEIWLIRNGEKSGPYHDYVIRSKIGDGDLGAEDHVWHEGLGAWTKLGEIEIFRNEFKDGSEDLKPPALPEEYLRRAAASAAQEKPKAYLGRRFFGRWLDLMVYASMWWLGMYFAGHDIGEVMRNPWLQLSIYVPWFVVESWLIHRFGTTPGKWLVGLRVRNEDGSKLELRPSIWRSIRVMVTGIGFGWVLLSVLCQAMSWFTARRIGKPIWDYLGGHKLEAVPLNPFKIMAIVFLFLASAHLQVAVRGPYEDELVPKDHPWLKELFETREKWYLPVKN